MRIEMKETTGYSLHGQFGRFSIDVLDSDFHYSTIMKTQDERTVFIAPETWFDARVQQSLSSY